MSSFAARHRRAPWAIVETVRSPLPCLTDRLTLYMRKVAAEKAAHDEAAR